MSQQTLPPVWRFAIFSNGLGSSISNAPIGLPTVNAVRFRFDSTGSAIFDSNTVFFSSLQASIGSNSYVVGSSFSNTSGWLGLDGLFSAFASGNLSGSLDLYLEASPDSAVWPSPASANGRGGGILIASIGFGSTVTVSTASTTRTAYFTL